MSDALDQLRERVRQNRAALSDELGEPAPKTTTEAADVKRTPVAGDRVLDRVTGQVGVVEGGVSTNVAGQTLYPVRLPGGGVLIRPAEQLARWPPPPARS